MKDGNIREAHLDVIIDRNLKYNPNIFYTAFSASYSKEVSAVLEWVSRVAGKVTLGDIIKYHREVKK